MLQPSGGGPAEHEQRGGKYAGGKRPTRTPSDRPHTKAANEHMREHDEVEGAQRGRWIEQRPEHERRREDQRLRISDARMAAVVIGIPERRGARIDGGGHESEEAVEFVLRIPG